MFGVSERQSVMQYYIEMKRRLNTSFWYKRESYSRLGQNVQYNFIRLISFREQAARNDEN